VAFICDENAGCAPAPAKIGSRAMHHDLDIFKDSVFWRALVIGILPIAVGGAFLVWLKF